MAGEIPVYCAFDKIVPLEELKPNPKNPNKHPQDQVELLARVIEAQGWRQPVKVSTRSGLIVSGHGRYEAALLLDCPVPVDFQSYPSDEDELADLLADNRISEMSEMDETLLRELFADLEGTDFNIDISGYTEDFVLDLADVIDGDLEVVGEVPFTEILREEHNYIVLYFDNEVDWLQAESLFELETVKALSTRTDGKITPSTERRGVGRVLRGAEALEVLRCAYQCELPKL